MARFALALLLVAPLACDSAEAPKAAASKKDEDKAAAKKEGAPAKAEAKPSADKEPAKPAAEAQADKPAPTAKDAAPQAAAEAVAEPAATPKAACGDFVFELGNPVVESKEQPNADDPVGRESWTQMLSLQFTCGDEEGIEDLLDLGFDCHGASCGCTYVVQADGTLKAQSDRDDCELGGDGGEEFAAVRGKPGKNVAASWVVITAAERAHLPGVEKFEVKTTDKGFEVVRTVSEGPAKVIFRR